MEAPHAEHGSEAAVAPSAFWDAGPGGPEAGVGGPEAGVSRPEAGIRDPPRGANEPEEALPAAV